jgi:hypothetical protein
LQPAKKIEGKRFFLQTNAFFADKRFFLQANAFFCWRINKLQAGPAREFKMGNASSDVYIAFL